jgi:hypothetical protein
VVCCIKTRLLSLPYSESDNQRLYVFDTAGSVFSSEWHFQCIRSSYLGRQAVSNTGSSRDYGEMHAKGADPGHSSVAEAGSWLPVVCPSYSLRGEYKHSNTYNRVLSLDNDTGAGQTL